MTLVDFQILIHQAKSIAVFRKSTKVQPLGVHVVGSSSPFYLPRLFYSPLWAPVCRLTPMDGHKHRQTMCEETLERRELKRTREHESVWNECLPYKHTLTQGHYSSSFMNVNREVYAWTKWQTWSRQAHSANFLMKQLQINSLWQKCGSSR